MDDLKRDIVFENTDDKSVKFSKEIAAISLNPDGYVNIKIPQEIFAKAIGDIFDTEKFPKDGPKIPKFPRPVPVCILKDCPKLFEVPIPDQISACPNDGFWSINKDLLIQIDPIDIRKMVELKIVPRVFLNEELLKVIDKF